MSVFSLFSMQDKLEQELEAVKAERMRAAIQAAADKQLADAQQQVFKKNKTSLLMLSNNHCTLGVNQQLLVFQAQLTQTTQNYPMYYAWS